jgi:hypothetical protein
VSRRYYRHRRAYAPRAWPTILGLAVVAVACRHLLHAVALWQVALICFAFGCGGTQLRWMIWRWRHPVVTHDQYIEDLRRAAAPWN